MGDKDDVVEPELVRSCVQVWDKLQRMALTSRGCESRAAVGRKPAGDPGIICGVPQAQGGFLGQP